LDTILRPQKRVWLCRIVEMRRRAYKSWQEELWYRVMVKIVFTNCLWARNLKNFYGCTLLVYECVLFIWSWSYRWCSSFNIAPFIWSFHRILCFSLTQLEHLFTIYVCSDRSDYSLVIKALQNVLFDITAQLHLWPSIVLKQSLWYRVSMYLC